MAGGGEIVFAAMTPRELADELGISPATLRAWLRRRYPRPGDARRSRWLLTEDQVAAARSRWPERRWPTSVSERPRPTIAPLYAAHRRRQRRPKSHLGRRLGALLLVGGLIVAVLTGVGYTGVSAFRASCSLTSEHPIQLGSNSFVYAANRTPLGMVPAVRHRDPVPLVRISPWLPKATVAIEDHRYWQHGALDYEGIVRAALADIQAGHVVQGGSTIAEQLVRNLYIGTDTPMSLEGKVDEACLAVQLSQVWSKPQILQAYLNQIYYGNYAYGAQAAAETYFGRPASRLSLSQAALLAGLPQAPTAYDPFRRPHAALARRNEVLAAMLANGDLSAARYRVALRTPVRLRTERRRGSGASDFFRYVTTELDRRFGPRRAGVGGLKVETTLSARMQSAAGAAIASHLVTPGDPAAALVAIDPETGAIKAMTSLVPGHRQPVFNLAAQAHRQAGSALQDVHAHSGA